MSGDKPQVIRNTNRIQLDVSEIGRVQKELGEFKGKTRQVIRTAVNNAARQAQKKLVKSARETYLITSKELKNSMAMTKATTRTLAAVITVRGYSKIPLDYKTSPSDAPDPRHPPKFTKAKVMRKSPMKPLVISVDETDIKAFVQKVSFTRKDGTHGEHVGVFQRKDKRRYPLKALYAVAVPRMFSEGSIVTEKTMPDIRTLYIEEVTKQLEKALDRARRAAK